MKSSSVNWKALLFVGLVLGLGWAIRGVFGHWWGASWAGGMGALALLVLSRRQDWLQRLPVLAALGAIGWGVGGIMSYGVVIGYCRSDYLLNSFYGYSMLAVIGGLYGFIGGGLLGLGLESSAGKRPDWARLLVEMCVLGWLAYWFLITELEWKMTPPRSEDWALCFGAAVAMSWYYVRNGYLRALRVAAYSALGAGFGFAFGNFIQVMGSVSGLSYNWWNVMEFTLGLCGGLGMTYAVLSTTWPESTRPSNNYNWLALTILVFAIPFVNFFQQFSTEKLFGAAENLGVEHIDRYVDNLQWAGIITILLFTVTFLYIWKRYRVADLALQDLAAPIILFLYTAFYLLFGYFKHGTFYTGLQWARSETAYLLLLPLILLLWYRYGKTPLVFTDSQRAETLRRWLLIVGGLLVLFLLLALISTGSHDGLKGAQERF